LGDLPNYRKRLSPNLRKPRLPYWAWIHREARKFLAQMRSSQGHRFWHDDISIADLALFNLSNRVTSRQVTDIYLLGLACRQSGKFATFDQRVDAEFCAKGSCTRGRGRSFLPSGSRSSYGRAGQAHDGAPADRRDRKSAFL
jgi:hypothetical protein